MINVHPVRGIRLQQAAHVAHILRVFRIEIAIDAFLEFGMGMSFAMFMDMMVAVLHRRGSRCRSPRTEEL